MLYYCCNFAVKKSWKSVEKFKYSAASLQPVYFSVTDAARPIMCEKSINKFPDLHEHEPASLSYILFCCCKTFKLTAMWFRTELQLQHPSGLLLLLAIFLNPSTCFFNRLRHFPSFTLLLPLISSFVPWSLPHHYILLRHNLGHDVGGGRLNTCLWLLLQPKVCEPLGDVLDASTLFGSILKFRQLYAAVTSRGRQCFGLCTCFALAVSDNTSRHWSLALHTISDLPHKLVAIVTLSFPS